MITKSKTVVFFGNERLATGVHTTTPTLIGLVKAGYEVAAVVVNQDDYKSRSSRDLEIEITAKRHNIPVLKPNKLINIKDELESFGAIAGILAAYGKIIPSSIINLFPSGIINIHPSLLPKGRGSTPIEQVILDGSKETGVSIMQLAEDMDGGPVFAQTKLKLNGNETKQGLADNLLKLGSQVLIEHLPGILSGTNKAVPQDESLATYNDMIKKEDGIIDWHKPAEEIEREVRAYRFWPKSRTTLGRQELILTEASVSKRPTIDPGQVVIEASSLFVGCGHDLLEITKLQPVNKPEMSAQAFLAGYRQLLTQT